MDGISLPVIYLTFSNAPGWQANGPEPVTDLVNENLDLRFQSEKLHVTNQPTCSSYVEPETDDQQLLAETKPLEVSHFSILSI